MLVTRRESLLLAGAAFAAVIGPAGAQGPAAAPFGHETVVAIARELAAQAYVPPDRSLPAPLDGLSYDDYRRINFRRERTLLRSAGSDFGLQLFHRGGIFHKRVKVNMVTDGVAAPLAYTPEMFDFGVSAPPSGLPDTLGFAGLRLLYPLNNSSALDELASFLGSSYFRFLGKGQRYGLSARGISIGSGAPHEEFPDFVEFWVVPPATGGGSIAVHALLDGPSITGAYRFVFAPGKADEVEVQATLFARKDLVGLGIAPLTSMFLYGENTLTKPRDFRPEVHDSDGLAMRTIGGEWIWRPLRNPNKTLVSDLHDTDPNGFGLLQRDRDFSHYQDLEARYDLRPGYWVEMKTRLGQGRVALAEIHSGAETDDNIVASWVPDEQPHAGSETMVAYVIRSVGGLLHDGGYVVASFETHAASAGAAEQAGTTRFLVDFAGGGLGSVALTAENLELVATSSKGGISAQTVVHNPATGGFRASFDVALPPGEDIDLRAFLKLGEHAVTETWSYRREAD